MLKASKQKVSGRQMDWLIDHLVEHVTTYYWYARKLRECGFVRNVRQELIVVSAIVRAEQIPDEAVLLNPDGEDIALVGSINHKSYIWIVYSLDSEMAVCSCPLGLQGDLCKHTVKVFKMLHPNVQDGLFV